MKVRDLMRELRRYPDDYEVDVTVVCVEVPYSILAECDGVDDGGVFDVGRLRLSAVTEGVKLQRPRRRTSKREAGA